MEHNSIYNLMKAVEGRIIPNADSSYDAVCNDNLEAWEELLFLVVDDFLQAANSELREYNSARYVSDRCRAILGEVDSRIKYYMDDWKEDEQNG